MDQGIKTFLAVHGTVHYGYTHPAIWHWGMDSDELGWKHIACSKDVFLRPVE
jgi:hypothetical protein